MKEAKLKLGTVLEKNMTYYESYTTHTLEVTITKCGSEKKTEKLGIVLDKGKMWGDI